MGDWDLSSDVVRFMIKELILGAAIGLLFAWRMADRHDAKRARPALIALLCVLALAAVVAYFDFGVYPKHGHFINPHDFFHYYLGSKYSPELGYFDIYNAVIVADAENNSGRPAAQGVRRQTDYRHQSVNAVMANKKTYRALFSDERWEAFKKDVAFFRNFSGRRWAGIVKDKGYNATPVWNMTARALTSFVPPEGLPLLASLDLILLCVMFVLVGLAFGWHAMLLTVVFFGASFMMAYPHIRGAFLRLDWLTLLVMSTCLLKLGRYKTAGALAAYAGLARIFPLIFMFGMGAKAAVDYLRPPWPKGVGWAAWRAYFAARPARRGYLEFFLAFAVVLAVLLGASILHDGGTGHWKDFFAKIELHDADLSPMRVGFRYVFLGTHTNKYDHMKYNGWGQFERDKLERFERTKAWWYAIWALVLLLGFAAVQRLEDYETIPFGYAIAYFMTAPTFYYQIMALIPLFLFLPRLDLLHRALGAAGLFGLSIVLYIVNGYWPLYGSGLQLSYFFSVLLLVVALYILASGFLAYRTPRTATAAPAAPPAAPNESLAAKPASGASSAPKTKTEGGRRKKKGKKRKK